MKKTDIKRHLKEYSVYQQRKTTINHAFASALSVAEKYDEGVLDTALRILGQNPNDDLKCVYCDKPAKTWDHVFSVVNNSEFSGIGHQIGNLLPCCKECNSQKGRKDWKLYLYSLILEPEERDKKIVMIQAYIDRNTVNIKDKLQQICNKELKELKDVKEQIFELMKRADTISATVRQKIKEDKKNSA